MNILFIDVETTGQEEHKHTITEIAFRLDVDGKTVDTFSKKLFNPKCVINLGALTYNNQKLKELVSSEQEDRVVIEICDWLLTKMSQVKGKVYWCGQNVAFDLKFLRAMLRRYDIENLDYAVAYKAIDTFCLAYAAAQGGFIQLENDEINLVNVTKALNIDSTKYVLHKAADDVNLTAEVYYKLMDLLKKS